MLRWRKDLENAIKAHGRLNNLPEDQKETERYVDEAVQKILDRIIFIRVCEDRGLEEEELLKSYVRKWGDDKSRTLNEYLSSLFANKNREYNSGLFAPHYSEKLTISNEVLAKIISESYVNPNGLTYDYSAIDADILGTIYENYLIYIQKRVWDKAAKEKSKRKEQGIYYTPTYVVDYIIRNTLGEKLKKSKTPEEALKIRLVDPACGSGSFLIRAYDEFKSWFIANQKGNRWEQTQLGLGTEKSVQTFMDRVLENCIYGVDLDPKAVEITQLNLLLRSAQDKHRLPKLNHTVQCGNSLIDDGTIAGGKEFHWEERFPEVFADSGFDVVVGNPPYVRVQNLKHEEIDWYKSHKETAYKRVDISILFIELAKRLSKTSGFIGYISSNQFLVTEYGRKLREFILKNYRINQIIDFGDLPIFEDALTYVSIFIFLKDKGSNFKYLKIRNLDQAVKPDLSEAITISVNKLSDESWVLADPNELNLIKKIARFPRLDRLGGAWAGIITGLDEVLMLSKEQVNELSLEDAVVLPLIRGKDPRRYSYVKPSKYVIYPYKVINDKTVLLDESELREKYPKCYNYLLENKGKLSKRKDSREVFADRKSWFGLIRFGTKEVFNKIKIVTPGEVKVHKFGLDMTRSGFSCARVFAITVDDSSYNIKYILGLLNSNTIRFYLQHIAPLKQGGFYTYSSTILNQIPIKAASKTEQDKIAIQVDKILSLKESLNNLVAKDSDSNQNISAEIENLEKSIDKMVYDLYGIEDEQEIIKNFINQEDV